jgi:hypothetical protein
MGELLMGSPICPGQSELDQLEKIVALLGTPTDEQWPGLKSLPNFGKVVLKQQPSQLRNKFQVRLPGKVVYFGLWRYGKVHVENNKVQI